jgi:membrane-bound serine protease (ClpP class)
MHLDPMKKGVFFLFFVLDEILIGVICMFLVYFFTDWDLWSIGLIIVVLALILTFLLYVFIPQFKKPQMGREGMIGLSGIALTSLNPTGQVKVAGEIWVARSVGNTIKKGCKIWIVGMDGLVAIVKSHDK